MKILPLNQPSDH